MAKIKTKDYEDLSESNVKKVIDLLEAESPITKKAACEILNISYNTTRLNKIIENYKAEQEELSRRRAANRGKPASNFEIQVIIEGYLDGDPINEISKRIYRSPTFVKEIVEKIGVPERVPGANYLTPGIIPEPCVREEFEIGSIVWNARKHCMSIVMGLGKTKNTMFKYYSLYNIEEIEEPAERYSFFPTNLEYGGYYDGAYAYDLGSLDHLKEYGVDIYKPYRACFAKWLK